MERHMKKTIAVLGLTLIAAGCGPSVPAVPEDGVLHVHVMQHSAEIGVLAELGRVNGRETEVDGAAGYVLEIEGAIRTLPGVLIYRDIMGGLTHIGPFDTNRPMMNVEPVPFDSLYVFEAEVTFQKTEEGWRAVKFKKGWFALCGRQVKSMADCRKSFNR
jgi:hypothetical protein